MKIILFLLLVISSFCFGQSITQKDDLINFINSKGEKNGVWIEQEDILKTISLYSNGKMEGSCITIIKSRIANIMYFSNNKLNGTSLFFNKRGILTRLLTIKNDSLNGLGYFFSPKGKIIAVCVYQNNALISFIYKDSLLTKKFKMDDYLFHYPIQLYSK